MLRASSGVGMMTVHNRYRREGRKDDRGYWFSMLAPFTAFDEHIYTCRSGGVESPGSLVLNPFECRGFQGSEGIKQPGVFCLGGSDQSHQDSRITI